MTTGELQTIVDAAVAQATANSDAEASAVGLLNTLGAFFVAHKDDPAAIEAMGTAMTNSTGSLKSSADSLAAAIVANTPVA